VKDCIPNAFHIRVLTATLGCNNAPAAQSHICVGGIFCCIAAKNTTHTIVSGVPLKVLQELARTLNLSVKEIIGDEP
jgi:hypothetical protein